MSSTMDAATRLAFNMKVLKRHDPHIDDIIESASFVVLYAHDGEWTKTGIEGPMFLYRRNTSPPYGFFILNRNGVENFSADLSPQDDLDLTPEFIIYRSGRSDDDDTYGIWVFEPGQRENVGQQMVKLQQTPLDDLKQAASVAHAAGIKGQSTLTPSQGPSSQQTSQSINLDALFGSVPRQGPAVATAPASIAEPAPSAGPSMIASNKPNGLALLDSMFQSAQSPAASKAQTSSLPPSAASTSALRDDAAGLKALLGLSPSAPIPRQPAAAAPPADASGTKPSENGVDALMARTKLSTESVSDKPVASSVASEITDAALAARASHKSGQLLERRDFIREVLSLIHTDPTFVDDLYGRYRRRMGQI